MKFHLQNGFRKAECNTKRSFVGYEQDPDRLPVLIQCLADARICQKSARSLKTWVGSPISVTGQHAGSRVCPA
jgi:hypothetical protein